MSARFSRASSVSFKPLEINTTLHPRQRRPLKSLREPDDPPLSPVSIKRMRDKTRERWNNGRKSSILLILGVGVVGLGIVVLVWGVVGFKGREPLRIPHREYQVQPYQHLDFSQPISLAPLTKVFHVTKEFGPATMGGLGVMLTALSIAQSESPYLSISVILPHYSFLRHTHPNETTFFTTLSVPIFTYGTTKHIECTVSKLTWTYSSLVDFLNPNLELDLEKDQRHIDIYLIGPGKTSPFHVAFKAKDSGDVYTAYKPLKQEWKDLWFAKSAAELISFLGYDEADSASIFEGDGERESGVQATDLTEEEKRVDAADEGDGDVEDTSVPPTSFDSRPTPPHSGLDVVHLHGATNAMVAHFLCEPETVKAFGGRPPAIVYTLHDSLDEVEYSNRISNLVTFLSHHHAPPHSPSNPLDELSPYLYSDQIFTSALGIDLSDQTTFVSQSIATQIVQGDFEFSLHSLVMPSIALKAREGNFIGITNGLDFTESRRNPFTSRELTERSLAFPRVGKNVSDPRTYWEGGEERGGRAAKVSFAEKKAAAKRYLIQNWSSEFRVEDLERPFLLFIGRFQYNKGCQFFEPLLELLSSTSPSSRLHNARLILMGAPNNYPISSLRQLRKTYPDHFTLIDDLDVQNDWGTVIRMASDFAFVPSFSEAFGLVAVEGMLFGMEVISTGVGGLSEFLVDRKGGVASGNSWLFDLSGESGNEEKDFSTSAGNSRPSLEELGGAIEGMKEAVRPALESWRRRMDDRATSWMERDRFVRRLVGMALELKWDREKGPIEEYVRVYDRALSLRRPSSTTLAPASIPPLHSELDALDLLGSQGIAVPSFEHGGHDQVSGEEIGQQLLQEAGALPGVHDARGRNPQSKDRRE